MVACSRCKAELGRGDWLNAHICGACGVPLPVCQNEDVFTALGAPQRFGQDRALLERRFYEASRALHPDRFASADASVRAASVERMGFLNDAWRTLKDPALRREALLKLLGFKSEEGSQSRGQIPAELAEGWFELQDALTEDPSQAAAKLGEFEAQFKMIREAACERMGSLEREIDTILDSGQKPEYALLGRLQNEVRLSAYFASMQRDIDRIRARL